MFYPGPMTSYVDIHVMNNRAFPESILLYKLAIQLFKLNNSKDHPLEWISLNPNQILTSHQSKFLILKSNKRKVGLNVVTNRFSTLNSRIPLEWMNKSLESFKIECKRLWLGVSEK